MAYLSSTEATSKANPPILLVRGMGQITTTSGNLLYSTGTTDTSTSSVTFGALTGGTGIWYHQTSDPSSTIIGTRGYFSDGQQLGMRNGDIIFVLAPSSGGSTGTVVLGINALVTTNASSGFSLCSGSQMYSTA